MAQRILIVYYSRTGTSEIVAKALQEKLGCDIERIGYADPAKRPSFLGAAFEAIRKRHTVVLSGDTRTPMSYNRLIVVSPVWAGGLSTPVRSYLKKHREDIAAYGLISVSSGGGSAVASAAAAAGKMPDKAVVIKSPQVKDGTFDLAPFLK